MTSKPEAHVHKESYTGRTYFGNQFKDCQFCTDREEYISKLEAVVEAGRALTSAAWLKPIQQIMYGDSGVLRDYNVAVRALEDLPKSGGSEV